MAQIRVILRQDDGSVVERHYDLGSDLSDLDSIDEAVEQFKNEALPALEHQLLLYTQARLVSEEKKNRVGG